MEKEMISIVRDARGRLRVLLGDGSPLAGVSSVEIVSSHGDPAEVIIRLAGAAVRFSEAPDGKSLDNLRRGASDLVSEAA